MAISMAKGYHTIPSHPEDHYPDVHIARVGSGDHLHPFLARRTYFLLGCASLLPWNVLTNGTPFFLSRLANSPFYSTFSSSLLSIYTVVKLFCLSYCTITSVQSSPSRRIFVSIIITIFFITSLCLSTFIQGTPSTFFSFGLFSGVALAIANSYLYAAVYAQAALLGPSFLQGVLSGQAAIAIAISTVQVVGALVSLWGHSPQLTVSMAWRAYRGDYEAEEIAARIFFGVSTLFLGVTLIAYTWLTKQASYQLAISVVKRRGNEDTDELAGLVANGYRSVLTYEISRVYRIYRQSWIDMFSIAYVFTVTLVVFPEITVRVRPVNPDIPPVLFTAVHFLVFNIGDLIGRLGHACPSPRLRFLSSTKNILVLSLARTLFIPLILVCNVYRPGPVSLPRVLPIVHSDVFFMIILLALGYTNGFVACIAMLAVSSPDLGRCQDAGVDVDVAAALGGTFQMVGLAVGALASFGVEALA